MRRFAVVLACTTLTLLLAPAAFGVPQDPNALRIPVECEGASVTVVLHPGIGKPLWDVSTEDVSHGPDFLIKAIDQEIFVNGESIGVFSYTFGNRTGQGEPITCTYYESFTDPTTGDLVEVYGTSYIVPR